MIFTNFIKLKHSEKYHKCNH